MHRLSLYCVLSNNETISIHLEKCSTIIVMYWIWWIRNVPLMPPNTWSILGVICVRSLQDDCTLSHTIHFALNCSTYIDVPHHQYCLCNRLWLWYISKCFSSLCAWCITIPFGLGKALYDLCFQIRNIITIKNCPFHYLNFTYVIV
jgi:hypothetical protein